MKEWFSAAELAGLPGLPSTERQIRTRAKRERWQRRARSGCGGGAEYHASSLPERTRAAIDARVKAAIAPATPAASPSWESWERQPQRHRDEALRRVNALLSVHALTAGGTAKIAAYARVASEIGESTSTVRRWARQVKGEPRDQWAMLLLPKWTGRVAKLAFDQRIYAWYRDLYLDQSRPSHAISYERTARLAKEAGLAMPSHDTLQRELERREDRAVIVLERWGKKKAQELYPYLQRTKTALRAMQMLNADGHKLDLLTVWPDGEAARAILITIQDLYSGAIVGWRLAKSESAHHYRLAFLDVCDRYGLCEQLFVDNTLAAAAKQNTAGAKNRRRFKDSPGDPVGTFPALGVEVRFVLPAHGQSKPIERAFGDLVDRIAKHPAFSGAYTGDSTVTKPSNYGERTVSIAELTPYVAQAIIEHNTRNGRRTATANGRSFWATFEESAVAHADKIRRISPEQRRQLYLVAEAVTVDRRDGCVKLFGNRYWSEATAPLAGMKVVVRYHPTERTLHDAIHVYRVDGTYVGEVPCYHAAGFADAEAARTHGRARRQFAKSKKHLADARRQLTAAEVAARLPLLSEPTLPNTGVVRPAFGVNSDVTIGPATVPEKKRRPLPAPPVAPDRAVAREERAAAARRVADALAPLLKRRRA